MDVSKKKFGTLSDGSKVSLYRVSNGSMSFVATNYGCVITSIQVPSRIGVVEDVVLAPPTLDSLVISDASFGGIVGRFANRISGGRFVLNGKDYQLDMNEGANCLHGGFFRWDKQVWDAEVVETVKGTGVIFSRISRAGEQGMPGTLQVKVAYLLDEENNLVMHYSAISDADTIISLTNHSYFNLAGHNKGRVDSHLMTLDCDHYLATKDGIPTGEMLPVGGTIFDFTKEKPLGQHIHSPELQELRGYDHCYCIDSGKGRLVPFAKIREPESGRTMTVATDMPGVQLYTGNWLQGELGKNGARYNAQGGFCLETQRYPDSPNKYTFPSAVLKAGEEFTSTTVYGFRW